LAYGACCEPFINGDQQAPTPGQLMRSRYSAYVKQCVDYLLATWHPNCQAVNSRDAITDSCKNTQWLGLTLVEEKAGQHADEGYVEFIARFTGEGTTPLAIHERSRFLRLGQRWYYIDGIHPQLGRNAACPCGSGKKYKKCCGQ
jgi:SEC-C motif-containing protein